MTSLLAFALAVQVAPTPAPATVEEEVVVIGNKLKAWRARVRKVDGQMRCAVLKSTGDKEVDAIGCRAMATCLPSVEAQVIASADRKLSRAARQAARTQAERQLTPCVMGERSRLIEELAERRYQASR